MSAPAICCPISAAPSACIWPDRQSHPLWRCAVVGAGHPHHQGRGPGRPPRASWRDRRCRNRRCASFFVQARRETDRADAGSDRPPFFASHRCDDVVASLERAADRRLRRQDAGDDPERVRRPAFTSPGAQIAAGLTLSHGRMHEDGVPHPQPHAGRPRFLRGHPRRHHRQGLEAAMAAGDARCGRARPISTPISRRSANGSSSCERDVARARVVLAALDGRGDLRLVPAGRRGLLPAVRHALLDQADRLLSGLALALRPDAGALAGGGGGAGGVLPLRRSRACGCWPPGGR